MRNSPTEMLEGITEIRNTFDSAIAVLRVSSMLVAFGSTDLFLKISSVSTPTEPGLEDKNK